ncbi:UPF0182 family protein [Nocardioides sp. R-C-SC26]|uniref:UPF0182 family membrane protein n=1 Tax=Nocardioides sp. R-C-SC26 TaxID=2870414 RepID=UPI001E4420AF|nr:UPF0182 family protein [Nocardioides sp. R-C-SC26]
MSDLFDDDPRAMRPADRRPPRRSRALMITAGIVIATIFGLTAFSSIYIDRLWYSSAGYSGVFSTMLWTRIGLFLVFGAFMGGIVALNVYLAYRFRPLFRPASREQSNLDRYRDVVTPIRAWVVVAVAVVIGGFAGASGLGHWRTYLLWRNGGDFGTDDPYFGRDIGFYVFDLPWMHFVVDFLMATFVIAIVASMITHYLFGGLRLQVQQDRLSPAAQVQLSLLLGLFVLAKGVDYYLDRFDLVSQKNGLFTGMNYTADNAVLPSKNILMGVAVICAILFFLNVWRRTWQLPSVGLALLALSAVLLGMIWPGVVQQFQVKPSEADKEAPYIAKNIESTRDAYDLTDVQTEAFSPRSSTADVGFANLLGATSSVPLVDPKEVQPAFENIQQSRAYYSVPDVLDVDHYVIDGRQRALVLAVRELDQNGLQDDARNWSNEHTVYTHGSGIIAAYANQRGRNNAEQLDNDEGDDGDDGIEWAQGINRGETDLEEATGDFESRVYYGELSPEYSVVGKASAGAADVELNLRLPDVGSSDGTETDSAGDATVGSTTFEGEGDAPVGSTFNQLMFAIKYGEPNFLLSGRVNGNSQVLFERNPRERVEKVAPWLTVDSDIYPAIVDGRILWIVDGYTTTDRYPGSQKQSFDTMTEDALAQPLGIQTLPTDEINYMRNSVKATVDAYSGEVSLYEWDEDDALLDAWMSAFPGTVKPQSEMSEELLAHVRYPEDLFKVQRYQYARYHVEEAKDWYENNARWEVPVDPQSTNTFQAPYRLFVDGGEGPEFSLTSVYVPYAKNNLASFMSVSSQAGSDDYGVLRVRELQTEQIKGPGQVSNDFVTDSGINAALLPLKNSGARVTYGNLLTFPVGDRLMNVQPVYAASQSGTTSSFPRLRYVLVKFGDQTGYGTTLDEALQVALGSDGGGDPGDGGGDPGEPTGTLAQQRDRAVDQALAALEAAQEALASGDLGEYQTQVGIAEDRLTTAADLKDRIDAGGGAGGNNAGAGTEPGDDASASPGAAPATEPEASPSAD